MPNPSRKLSPPRPDFGGLRPAALADLRPYAGQARRDHVAVGATRSPTHWYWGVMADGEPLGFAAYMVRGPGQARIKGIWVMPEWRGLGYGDAMSAAIVNAALDAGLQDVDILSWEPRWAARNGFTEAGRNGHGATRLRRTFKTGERLGTGQ